MNRTTQTIIGFASPFILPGFDAPQPAGNYRLDIDEEMIGGASLVGWRRTGLFLHLPAIGSGRSTRQMVPVASADLDAAIQLDMQQ